MGETINEWIDALVAATGLEGWLLLLLTVPLAVVQGLLGLFPFLTLIMLHISSLGLVGGFFASWFAGTLAAVVVFWFARSLFAGWFDRKFSKRLQKYEKWQRYFDKYGVWVIIFLRTLPIMPNNLISFMAAISPIKPVPYIWSSIVGNVSHIWLFAILTSSVLFPDTDIRLLIGSYVLFTIALLVVFLIRSRRFARSDGRTQDRDLEM